MISPEYIKLVPYNNIKLTGYNFYDFIHYSKNVSLLIDFERII